MSYCSDCIGGFSVRRKINGEKFRPNFRATTTDMLQINEQICSDNYEIDANTLMPKPTLSCGADGQPENLDFQFYEDRKCDGIQDCENGFDESDCEEMPTVDLPKMDENGPVEDDEIPVACCKYLRFERTFCHHIRLDSNPFGGALDAWECNDGSVFFRITGMIIVNGITETTDEWTVNSNGKPGANVWLPYKKMPGTWEKNCPEGGYTSSLNDGYHHLICVTEEQFKMNAPCLYKKLNPNTVDNLECFVEPPSTDDADGEGTDGEGADGEDADEDGEDNEQPYMPTEEVKRPKEYYNLQVGQFLVQVEMNLALSIEFPEDQSLSLTLTELENMAGEGQLEEVFQVTDELKKSFEITFKDLVKSEEHFIFEISIAEGTEPDFTSLDIFIEFIDPMSTPMLDDWQPDSLLTALLKTAEDISSQMNIAYQPDIHGILFHQTSKYLKVYDSSYCHWVTPDDFDCGVSNSANIRNEDIEMINFQDGFENFQPYRNPTIRMLVDIEIELPKDAQIKEALKSKIYELGNGKTYPGYKAFHEVNPFGYDGYTFFECQDDGVSGTLKTGSATNLKKTSKRKRREAYTSDETETLVLLIDYVTNPEGNEESYDLRAIIQDLLSDYDSKKNSFPYIEEHIYMEIEDLIETEFEIYDSNFKSHFYIEAPSAFVYNIKEVGLGMTLQENFTPVQFIRHDQMLHRVHVEVPTEQIFLETPSWLQTMVDDMDNGKKPDELEDIESIHFLESKIMVHDYITSNLVYALPGGSDIDNCKITAVLNAECLLTVNAILLGNEDKTCIQFALECIEEDVSTPLTLDELIDNNIQYEAIQDYLGTDTDPEIISIQRKMNPTKNDPDEWSISYLYPVGEEVTIDFPTVDELLQEYNTPYWFINDDDSTDVSDLDALTGSDGNDSGGDGSDNDSGNESKYVTVRVEIEVKLTEPFTSALTDPSSDEFKNLEAEVVPNFIISQFEQTNPFPGGETNIIVTFTPASEARRRKRRLAAGSTNANLEIFFTSNPDIPIKDVEIPNIDELSSSIVEEAKSALAMSLVVDQTQLENLEVQVDQPFIPGVGIDGGSDSGNDGTGDGSDSGNDGTSDGTGDGNGDGTDSTGDGSDSGSDGTGDSTGDGSNSGNDGPVSCATCTSEQQSGPGLEIISVKRDLSLNMNHCILTV